MRKFVKQMSISYPFKSCRPSLNLLNFEENGKGYKLPSYWQFCDKSWDELDKLNWKACLGSTKNSRGYTCGLWNLFHSMLINGASFQVIRNFIKYFFQCDDCRKHFISSTDTYRRYTTTQGSSVIFMWQIHNKVNDRIKK